MPSSIHTRPWDAASEVICMLTDLRKDATPKDLDWNLSTMKDLAPIRYAPTPELKQAQTQVFDAFTNYIHALKDFHKPLGVTKDLLEQPSKAAVILDEVLTCVDQKTRWYDMDKIKTRITFSMRESNINATDDQKEYNRVYNEVMEAFAKYTANMFDDLDDNPKWCAVALEDLLDIVERNADYDDYCRMMRYAKEFIQYYDASQVENDKDITLKLQTDIMKAFLTYIELCNTVYLKKLEEEQSNHSSDEDEVFIKVPSQEEKKPYIPEPFPEHLHNNKLIE
ncbi:hypothetical protein AWC38_SpisGene22628 [Stylophora pistillata]|uniref:Uncharacterized protein n=1 Tax=Stylophora pistillata TaxID=50429 RepID=A0A2B4R6N9_STYPI|nr:hypothetical protein AWC38_SpisGene22628 [Stylophora pistillata]